MKSSTTRRFTAVGSPQTAVAVSRRWVAVVVAAVTVPICLVTHTWSSGTAPTPAASAVALLAVLALVSAVTGAAAASRTPLGVATGTAVGAAALLLGQLVLALWPQADPARACLPVIGRGAELGIRLTLLRADSACPAGQLVPTSALGGAWAAACLALALLAVHLVAAAVTGIALAALLAALVTSRLAHRTLRLLSCPSAVVGRATAARHSAGNPLPGGRSLGCEVRRRGPPAVVLPV